MIEFTKLQEAKNDIYIFNRYHIYKNTVLILVHDRIKSTFEYSIEGTNHYSVTIESKKDSILYKVNYRINKEQYRHNNITKTETKKIIKRMIQSYLKDHDT